MRVWRFRAQRFRGSGFKVQRFRGSEVWGFASGFDPTRRVQRFPSSPFGLPASLKIRQDKTQGRQGLAPTGR
jgi:hypothetical protein